MVSGFKFGALNIGKVLNLICEKITYGVMSPEDGASLIQPERRADCREAAHAHQSRLHFQKQKIQIVGYIL
jgi:hypothetical protein